jgi:SAM-dependent methyltransferase
MNLGSVGHTLARTKRGLAKLVVGPLRYGRKGGYDAERYWSDRFARYGRSLVASGNEGYTEAENERDYAEAATTFTDLCRSADIDLAASRVLEVGPGTGFYTALLAEIGVTDYVGVDITDKLFEEFTAEWPDYRFVKQDVSTEPLELDSPRDVALMIDVLEHIVDRDKLAFALRNVAGTLRPGGRFVVGPVYGTTKRWLFYVHWWTRDDVAGMLEGTARPVKSTQFREGELMVFERSTPGA